MSENRGKYLFKNIGILTISNFASKILVFLLVPLYTNVLTTSEYGSYDIVYSTIQLFFPILTLNISDAVMRFSMDTKKNIDDVAVIGFRVLLRSLIPVTVFMLGCWFWGFIPAIRGYELLILFYCVFYFCYQFLIQMAKGMERVADMGISGIISTIILLGCNILLLIIFKTGLSGFYLSNVLSQMIPSIYLATRIEIWKFSLFKSIDRNLKKEMLIYCIPLVITVLGWWVNNTIDKYTVAIICGASANGLLSVAYKIPSIINVFQNIFIQAWQISAIKEYGNHDTTTFYGKTFKILAVLMAAICSWLIFLTRPIGNIMYAKDFYAAWEYVPYLLIASLLNCAAGFLGPILVARKDSKAMALSAVYSSVANIILNIIFVLLIGVQGACIATAISSLIQYIARKRAVGKEIRVNNNIVVYLTWGLLWLQASIEVYTTLWWVEIMLMIIMFIINIDCIKEVVKMGCSIIR